MKSTVFFKIDLCFFHLLFFLSFYLSIFYFFNRLGFRNGLQTSYEADRHLSNVNGNVEVELGKVKNGEGNCKQDKILQV